MSNIQLNDIGTQFLLTVRDQSGNTVNLAASTSKVLNFVRPDLTTFSRDLSFVGDGSDGRVSYLAASGDLNQVGFWRIQAKFIFPTGQWTTNQSIFTVNPLI